MKKCIHCNSQAIEGRSSCDYHLQKAREETKRRRKRLKEKYKDTNICKICYKNPIAEGHSCCMDCVIYHREYGRKERAIKREKGLCYSCGNPTNNGRAYCNHCQGFGWKGDRGNKNGSKRGVAITRDDATCQICGNTEYVLVHHIDGNGYKNPDANHSPDNLITVCRSCHRYIHVLGNRLKKIPHAEEIFRYAFLLR